MRILDSEWYYTASYTKKNRIIYRVILNCMQQTTDPYTIPNIKPNVPVHIWSQLLRL